MNFLDWLDAVVRPLLFMPSNYSKPEIVPRGYWKFWLVLSLASGSAGVVAAFLERNVIFAVISFVWGVAWSVVYWRITNGK